MPLVDDAPGARSAVPKVDRVTPLPGIQPALTFDSSPMSRMLLVLLAAVAEMELKVLRQRRREVAAAKARRPVLERARTFYDS